MPWAAMTTRWCIDKDLDAGPKRKETHGNMADLLLNLGRKD